MKESETPVAILPLEIDAVEAFRPQAELRLNFAKAIQRKTGEPLSLTLFKYTDIYRRLGLGEPPKDVRGPEDLHPVWNALVREIRKRQIPQRPLSIELCKFEGNPATLFQMKGSGVSGCLLTRY